MEMVFWKVIRIAYSGSSLLMTDMMNHYVNTTTIALKAKQKASSRFGISLDDIDVVDSHYLSLPSTGLKAVIKRYSTVVFVDVCKEGQAPLEGMIPRLQGEGILPPAWRSVAGKCDGGLFTTVRE